MCLLITGCSSQQIVEEKISENDSQQVALAKVVKNKLLAYQKDDAFIVNTVHVYNENIGDDDMSENTMIRRNNKELYLESDSPILLGYANNKNYLYNTSTSEIVEMSKINPEHEVDVIIKPFIEKYVQTLDWVINNEDLFDFTSKENTVNNIKIKEHTFIGKDNDKIKEMYGEAFDLFEFWEDSGLEFEFTYIFDEKDNLVEYKWTITHEKGVHMVVEGKLGRIIENVYSLIGYDLTSVFEYME
jgi:hypothetical protein